MLVPLVLVVLLANGVRAGRGTSTVTSEALFDGRKSRLYRRAVPTNAARAVPRS
jgi:hypothetical protein